MINYDRLIVLERGRIVEMDTPWNLIQKEDGTFRSMCIESGYLEELEEAVNVKAMNLPN